MQSELLDLQSDLKTSQEKQNELLSFTSKLTEKNTQLNTLNEQLSEKLAHTQCEHDRLKSLSDQSTQSVQGELEKLAKDLGAKQKESDKLKIEIEEKIKECNELSVKLADEQDENNSLKKKHAANIKDLTKQLQILQKREKLMSNNQSLNTSTSSTTTSSSNNDALFAKPVGAPPRQRNGSRKSSTSSLFDDANNATTKLNSTINDDTTCSSSLFEYQSNSKFNELIVGGGSINCHESSDVYVVDIDKQKLIEKIVKLQRDLARKNEKIDFLQDHVNQLTSDLKRKTKFEDFYLFNVFFFYFSNLGSPKISMIGLCCTLFLGGPIRV